MSHIGLRLALHDPILTRLTTVEQRSCCQWPNCGTPAISAAICSVDCPLPQSPTCKTAGKPVQGAGGRRNGTRSVRRRGGWQMKQGQEEVHISGSEST